MDIITEAAQDGIIERRFDLKVGDQTVPGLHWLPEHATAPHPTVLIGHGGTQHKRVPNVLGLARKLVAELGYGVVALDAPGHGDRMTAEERAEAEAFRAARQAGGPLPPLAAGRRARMAAATGQAVAEWQALLDDLGSDPRWADGPFGYWGVSMGTSFGIPLVAREPRISAAVLGLNALREGSDQQRASAEAITVPLLFLFQWDDELMTRDAGLALWDAFGSAEKTMHVNPGPHVGIPLFERDAAAAFYRRHLGG
ncbi:MAG TPA: alpha/beta hydrolase [Streptosporangiaceae bacterium]|nr:alpha/beta hydrolase [Streptosporangiaceae bacterium]